MHGASHESFRPSLGVLSRERGNAMVPEHQNTVEQDVVLVEDLIEEVSIDGMCGVY